MFGLLYLICKRPDKLSEFNVAVVIHENRIAGQYGVMWFENGFGVNTQELLLIGVNADQPLEFGRLNLPIPDAYNVPWTGLHRSENRVASDLA